MKRFLLLSTILAFMASFTACGVIGNEPDIDEGLHIAANDAKQRLDRLKDEDNGYVPVQGETDSNFDDPKPENPKPEPPKDPEPNLPDLAPPNPQPDDRPDPSKDPVQEPANDDIGGGTYSPDPPQPDDPWLDFAEDGPYVEPSEPNLPIGGDVLDRDDFWLDDNTYDLIGYAESIGCTIGYRLESDPSQPVEINYCGLKFYSNRENDDRYLSIYSTCNKADEIISTYSTEWEVVGGNAYYSANGYLDGNIVIPDPSNIAMVYIQNRSYWMPRRHLEATIDILTRLAADDPGCWYRGLGIDHFGQTPHDD